MLLMLAIALHLPGDTILRRHDRPDSAYRALGERYAAVGKFGRIGDGTLIGDRWVLTAAHVARAARNRGAMFEVANQSYAIRQVTLHPGWRDMEAHDIAVVELERPVPGTLPIALYRASAERGEAAVLVGHGGMGTGQDRERTEDGLVRGAMSRVDSTDADWLYFSFDAPPSGLELEGAPGPGDSGGPALLIVRGVPMLAGISSAGFDGAGGPGTYGAVDVFTRVSTHISFIESVVGSP